MTYEVFSPAQVDKITYNDKAYTSPELFGQFFNFRILLNFSFMK